jgi:hypothetical protein
MRQYYNYGRPKEQYFTVQLGGQPYGIQDYVEEDIRTGKYEISSVLFVGGYYVELPCSAIQAIGTFAFMVSLLVAAIYVFWRSRRRHAA